MLNFPKGRTERAHIDEREEGCVRRTVDVILKLSKPNVTLQFRFIRYV